MPLASKAAMFAFPFTLDGERRLGRLQETRVVKRSRSMTKAGQVVFIGRKGATVNTTDGRHGVFVDVCWLIRTRWFYRTLIA
jgi:hypothetical protein